MGGDSDAVCPLCNHTFSQANIASHASTCGEMPGTPIIGGSKRKLGTDSSLAPIFPSLKKQKAEPPLLIKSSESPSIAKSTESKTTTSVGPLAERVRPSDLSTYVGHEGILGSGTPLRSILDALDHGSKLPSLILWGPPGCGKTSLANVIAVKTKGRAKFVKMSACVCGVAEVREVVKQAKNELAMFKRQTILFMDEVHRFNKAQQDTFLPHIEVGTITFIGATTENPSFSLNTALLSRCRVVALEKLSQEALVKILQTAVKTELCTDSSISVDLKALEYLAKVVDGDARTALNNLQLVIDTAREKTGGKVVVGVEEVREAVARSHVHYDRTGDQHYHFASALQKSIRGSADSAALYYLGRMLRGGEDPMFIARRLVRCASEDIGLADPTALPLAVSAMQGTQLLGKPECDVLLAQTVVHLARAPKSHEVYKALGRVYSLVDGEGEQPSVPAQLRNATGKMTREMGWGKGYSHELDRVGRVEYMPRGFEGKNFFAE